MPKKFNPHISYFETGDRLWSVYFLGRWLGHLVRGEASTCFIPERGRKRLYPSTEDFETELATMLSR